MGFNYLQTDDRDDYFDSIHKSKSKNRPIGYTLISPEGDEIFKEEPMFKLRTYCKKNYLPIGKGAKKIWREVLESKGYKVITVMDTKNDN